MKKMMIAGPVGSGKTTFAKQLAAKKSIPYYELDNLAWERHPTGDKPYTEEESRRQLQKILMNESWIIEGTMTRSWIKSAIESADIILVLLPPYPIRVYRIISRFIKQKTKLEMANYKPTFRILKMMFIWNHHYEKKNFLELQTLARLSQKKLTIVNNRNVYSSYKKEYETERL